MAQVFHRLWGALKRRAVVTAVRQARRIVRNYSVPVQPNEFAAPVRAALALPPQSCPTPSEDAGLRAELMGGLARAAFRPSRELFSLDGARLPCWLPGDETLSDDWLESPRYYPLYHALFQARAAGGGRMLEIGVRTGYMGVVFARAAGGQSFYMGLDPNLYVPDGLRRASDSLAALRGRLGGFDFALIEGYSWDEPTQRSLALSAPFDLIHIDGDHTLPGKLNDLRLAADLLAPGGLVLVDDYDHHAIVADAIRRALAMGWYQTFAYLPTLRGLAVLGVARGRP